MTVPDHILERLFVLLYMLRDKMKDSAQVSGALLRSVAQTLATALVDHPKKAVREAALTLQAYLDTTRPAGYNDVVDPPRQEAPCDL